MPLAAQTRLGPYEILSLIGAGGMGEVYKARDTRLDGIVALKVLPKHFVGNHYALSVREQRILVNTVTGEAATAPITVVLNWAAGRER